jgi:hypothetical protein
MSYTNTPDGLRDALKAVSGNQSRLWFDGDVIRVLPAPPIIVPTEVTMRQARLALHAAGKLVAVNAAIAALPDPPKTAALIEWEYSSTVRRDSQFVAMLGPALGLDAAGLDALFIAAAKLGV